MSISLEEVLNSAGYDVVNNPDDARWFLGQKEEFESLYEKAEKLDEFLTDSDYYEEENNTPLTYDAWLKNN